MKQIVKIPDGKVPPYNPLEIEEKWQSVWREEKTYQVDLDTARKPFFNLMMFPYPSAEGLHVGNMYAFTGSDIYGRFKRMQGRDVFEPIGLDGFGIHSENYAMKVGRTPQEHAAISEKNYYRQLTIIGNSFDWSKTVQTYDSSYYKWTQWLFIQLFKKGLAYRKKAPVNFCPKDKTVLADEQVIDGRCERCDSVVEKRNLEQWFFKITDYADRLLNNIDGLDWSEKVKIAQRNWIGKKEGIEITYDIEGSDEKIVIFTTRPDTNFGATFVALAPEHPLAEKITTERNKKAVAQYIKMTQRKTEQERTEEGKDKTGVFTGAYAINQLTGYRMPIWVSDFVLIGFGTGALIGVPGHDKRDFFFAKEFGLEIKRVVVGSDGDMSPIVKEKQVQEDEGIMVNSEFLDGMDIHAATQKIMEYMEQKGYGKRRSEYHLRDWLISRQRYLGPPIPLIFCEKDGWVPVPESELPVLLPSLENWEPTGNGESPLAQLTGWVNVSCPVCNGKARRETDVSDTFLDSSWYFLRYLATGRGDVPMPELANDIKDRLKWLPVNMYIGGAEHSVLHLLYSRFITMVLKDLGYIPFEEPFAKFRAHGLIVKEGAKMSKSKGNVVNPDDYIKKFGADSLRMYLMFSGPYVQGGDFYDSGIEGMNRFVKRVWFLMQSHFVKGLDYRDDREAVSMLHKTVKKVTEDISNLRYNTAIASLMEWYNFLSKREVLDNEEVEVFLKLLAPFAPHVTEELWQLYKVNAQNSRDVAFASIHKDQWPTYQESLIVTDTIAIAVQINGKTRDVLRVDSGLINQRQQIEQRARECGKVQPYLFGKTIKQTVYVSGKIVNFVI